MALAAVAAAVAFGSPAESGGAPRVWTDKQQRQVEAELAGVAGDQVMLLLADGKEVPFPLSNLSEDDQAFVAEQQAILEVAAEVGVFAVPPAERRKRPAMVSLTNFQSKVMTEPREPEDRVHVYRSDHFRFTSQVKIGDSDANTIAQAFEVTRQLVEALPWGIKCRPSPGGYQARLFATWDDYHREGGPPGSAGVYSLKDRVFLLPLQSLSADGERGISRNKNESTSVLTHEITHQMMHHYLPFVPMWVAEGTAEYVSLLPFTGRQYRISGAHNGLKRYRKALGERATLPLLSSFLTMTREDWQAIANQRGSVDGSPAIELYAQATFALFYFNHLEGDGSGLEFNRYMDATRETMVQWGLYEREFEAYSKVFEEVYKPAEQAHNRKVEEYNAEVARYQAAMKEFLELPGVKREGDRILYPPEYKTPEPPRLPVPGDAPVAPEPPKGPAANPEAAALANLKVLLKGRPPGAFQQDFVEKIGKIVPNLQVKELTKPPSRGDSRIFPPGPLRR